MTTGVTIRAAHAADVEAARVLTDRSWLETYTPLLGEALTSEIIRERHAPAVFRDQASAAGLDPNPSTLFLVAEKDGAIVGHCHAFAKQGCYVDRLHVAPGMKGQGIGRAMLDHVETRQPSGTRIWLEVLRGNDAAIAFYRRVGFRQSGETDACGGLGGIPAEIFEKTLEHEFE